MKHCWHSTGTGTGSYSGGSTMYRCCYCGIVVPIMYRCEEQPIDGHGDRVKATKRVYTWPDTLCEERG